MIVEEQDVLRRKTSMVLFEIERGFAKVIEKRAPELADIEHPLVSDVVTRERQRGNPVSTVKALLAALYFEEALQLSEKVTSDTEEQDLVRRLRQLISVLDIPEVRNACAHPTRPFLKAYWYRVSAIAADPAVNRLGLLDVIEALASAEAGVLSDPPAEWLAGLRWELPNNLPTRIEHAATGLVGRQKLREKVLGAISNPRTPVVALVARGGVGKTALILDVLRHVAETPALQQHFDRIVFVSLKDEVLTADGVFHQRAAATYGEVREEIADALREQGGLNLDRTVGEVFDYFSGDKLLLCVDNIETLLRDNPEVFAELNSGLPQNWRIVITSRVRVDGALTIPVPDLEPGEAKILAHKYGRVVGFVLPDSLAARVAELSKSNALAIKLTIDLMGMGHDLTASTQKVAADITQFSYDKLIDALSDNALRALEVLFVEDGCTRADIHSVIDSDVESIAEAISELTNTSLVSRDHADDVESFHLNESVREYLRVNPRNLTFRNEVGRLLRRQREIQATAIAAQSARGDSENSLTFIPSNLPRQLTELCISANKVSKDRKIGAVPDLLAKFRGFESDFGGYEIFWRAYGRVLQLVDKAGAELMFTRAIAVDGDRPQAKVHLAWLLSQQGRHDEAERIYEGLSADGWLDSTRSGKQLASYVHDGYLRSLLFGGKYGEVISQTAGWDLTDESMSDEAPFRIAAFRQLDGNVGDRQDSMFNAFDTLDGAIKKVGASKAIALQAIKLYRDWIFLVNRGCSNALFERGISSLVACWKQVATQIGRSESDALALSSFAEDCVKNGLPGADRLKSMVAGVSSIDAGKQKVWREEGYVITFISNIPRTSDGYFPRYVFARDDSGVSYYVSVDSLRDADWVIWGRLQVGSQIIVKPGKSEDKNKAIPVLETIIP